jgi:hypothetical protein
MPLPLPPEALGDLQNGPFSFYPPIVGIEHNEWQLRSATWTEVHVINTRTKDELWIPRHFLGEVARIEAPVTIVGLLRELEYREGALLPHRRRVIEMPRAVNGAVPVAPAAADELRRPAPVVVIRTEIPPPSRGHRLFRGSVALSILACVAAGFILRELHPHYSAAWSSHARPVELTPKDNYRSVLQKLGRPVSDQWLRTADGHEYRRLLYPQLGIAVILKGPTHPSAKYAGLERIGPSPALVAEPGSQAATGSR